METAQETTNDAAGMGTNGIDDEQLAALAARSAERAGLGTAPSVVPLEQVIADAQQALESRRRLDDGSQDLSARRSAVAGVLASLPAHCCSRTVRRLELRGRVHGKILAAVDAWGWDSPNLLVIGPTGVGKTSGAAELVRRLVALGVGGGGDAFVRAQLIRWQSCRELSEVAREMRLGDGVPEPVLRCQNARLLVLDDIGAQDHAPTLERILNARYERGWPTITTTGLRSRELTATFGEALVRRMLQRRGMDGRIVHLAPPP